MGTIYLTDRQAGTIGIEAGEEVLLRAGVRSCLATVRIVPTKPRTPLLPELLNHLRWPINLPCQLAYSRREQAFVAGPLLGIFSYRYPNKPYVWSAHLKETQRYAREMGVVAVVFGPTDINWEDRTVTGVILRGDEWQQQTLPLPRVIYNRIPSRKFENLPEVSDLKKRLADIPGLILFNPRYLDKWETHQLLQKHVAVRPLLPETRLLQKAEDLWPLVKEHRVIYIKPIHGTQGLGIYRIGLHPSGGYSWISRHSTATLGLAYTRTAIEAKIKRLLERTAYVAQQGLRLALIEGAPFDIRLLAQKDGQGVWRITKVFGRIAPPGKFTSNLSQGGRAMGILNSLKAASLPPKRKRQAILKELQRWGESLPRILEESAAMTLGELGLDLALDRGGKLWLLEINAKPFKRLDEGEGDPRLVRLALERPIAYGRFLDGFDNKGGDDSP
ncbi:hypothetical protein GTO89_12125 [Heliobacterium gestii]|uniref:ATP-grasp domain-containing protein n=1 Tax=Heliomicrobium gestii TaxID=2699 RepID=A0A845LE06_HELGE|nr:YheC/YheD family protein [Heliomicrobium gestii]MBM7867236.1 hypothetical protein [Heliomicrobium gestii]MZP43791.1 hypothetical protein [Heliomicrobium gestii]